MKKKTVRLAAAALALLLAAMLPLFAAQAKTSVPERAVPAGYNAHDYNKCAAFLELTDANGVKNGKKLNDGYKVGDPSTWGTSYGFDEDWFLDYVPCFSWYDNGTELMLRRVSFESKQLCGVLDLSGCKELNFVQCPINELTGIDVSGCAKLDFLSCYGNSLAALNVSGCTALTDLSCASTGLRELDVSDCAALVSLSCQINELTGLSVAGCSALTSLHCESNRLTKLDVSGCSSLTILSCYENELTELELSSSPKLERLFGSSNPLTQLDLSGCALLTYVDLTGDPLTLLELSPNDSLHLDTVRAEGEGYFDSELIVTANDVTLRAFPQSGVDFLGWYSDTGKLVSKDAEYSAGGYKRNVLIAVFANVTPGDVNGDGDVTVIDAVSALRGAMGIITLTPAQAAAADINGDGEVTVLDAVLILRAAMGIV